MKFVLLFTIIFCTFLQVQSQNPPSPSMPTGNNKQLIDSLMEVSRFKEYFIKYCDKKIDNAADINKWTFDQARDRKLKVNFDDFKEYTIYNWFSILSKDELLELISIISKLNEKNKYSTFLISHEGIQNNLELFVEKYLK